MSREPFEYGTTRFYHFREVIKLSLTGAAMRETFTSAAVLKLFRISRARLQNWIVWGVVDPTARGNGRKKYEWLFTDLIAIEIALEFHRVGLSLKRAKRFFALLRGAEVSFFHKNPYLVTDGQAMLTATAETLAEKLMWSPLCSIVVDYGSIANKVLDRINR